MEYKILTAGDPETLEGLVFAYINVGWEPQGGVALSTVWLYGHDTDDHEDSVAVTTYAQAMIYRK